MGGGDRLARFFEMWTDLAALIEKMHNSEPAVVREWNRSTA